VNSLLADRGTARIEQHAFADFLTRGELDRHLRRMRARYAQMPEPAIRAGVHELAEAVRATRNRARDAGSV